jgi:hypothetical protein
MWLILHGCTQYAILGRGTKLQTYEGARRWIHLSHMCEYACCGARRTIGHALLVVARASVNAMAVVRPRGDLPDQEAAPGYMA